MLTEEADTSIKSSALVLNKQTSRRFSEETLRSQKNYVTRVESSDNVREVMSSGSREDLRKRLKMFNDTEGELKTKSANRLTNIIAKIDRILSNSSRPNYDVEANRLEADREAARVVPYVPPLFSTFEDHSSESKSTEIFEMVSLNRRNYDKRKSKSARVEATLRTSRAEAGRAFSDGVVNLKGRGRDREVWNSGKFQERKMEKREERGDSSGESAGTYVVEIGGNQDEMIGESESSVRSDATFVVENEKVKAPVPKPRKKV